MLKRVNPLVRDFKMACEQFAEENIKGGRVVISADARPSSEHERRYNLQVIEIDIFVVSYSIINIATSTFISNSQSSLTKLANVIIHRFVPMKYR